MYNNFKEFLQSEYYNEIFEKVQHFAILQKDFIDFSTYDVPYVSYINLDDIHVVGVTYKSSDTEDMEFRISVEGDFEVSGKGKYSAESDSKTVTFCLFLTGILKDGLHNVRIHRVEEYSESIYDRNKSLSQDLVPYMYEEDVEKHAEEFLRKYCPKALLQPMPLPLDEIIEKMEMKQYYAPLEDNVFGKTYFDDEVVTVYVDEECSRTEQIAITSGTMLINPRVFYMRNIGTANNTIIHECVHWDRHRRPFELQKLLKDRFSHISCEVVRTYEGIGTNDTALKWMEWQANQLAPRILMPAGMTKRFYNSVIIKIHNENPELRSAVLTEKAVEATSQYFGVSNLAAKIRMIELGYPEVQGTFVFCDGRYLPPYTFASRKLEVDETFLIDEKNVLFLICCNAELGRMFCSNEIVYANSMLCINHEMYIERDTVGRPILTDYALEHVDECCFLFSRKINVSNDYSDTFYRKCFLCHDVNSECMIEAEYDPNHENNQNIEKRNEQLKKVNNQIQDMASEMYKMPGTFGPTLKFHMDRKNLTQDKLAERTYISPVSISKYINHPEENITLGYALALCNGLKLHEFYAMDFMKKAGHDMLERAANPIYIYAWFLISNHPDDTVDQWMEKIKESKINIKMPTIK